MSMCVRDIDFAYFYDFCIIFQKCSDNAEFIVFIFIYGSNLTSNAKKKNATVYNHVSHPFSPTSTFFKQTQRK